MRKKIKCFLIGGILSASISAQEDITYTFDKNTTEWEVAKGKVELLSLGAWKGRSMRLTSGTVVNFTLNLQPASVYELTAHMRTESGADNMTLQVTGLEKNNVSTSTALASWTKINQRFNVSSNQKEATLEIIFDNNTNQTYAWIDEIRICRIDNYEEATYKGIPPAPIREIKTDIGITMQPDEKIKWMLDDKLGMFIHWGLYAGPGKGEWYMENQGVSIEEYRKLAYPESGNEYFDAKDFNARKWTALAQKVGMRYACFTTQHHDGYALFESKYMNAFTSKHTHNRDFVKEYVEACREAGLKVGLYKTLINWRFPGYYDITGTDCRSDNRFGYITAAWHKENARLMKEELYCQIKELMTNYGKIDHLFWDGGWIAQRGTDAEGATFWESGKYTSESNGWPVNPYFRDYEEATGKSLGLMGIVRKYQPDIVVNPRSGWIGDYTCEEGAGDVKGEIRSGVVEKCVSLAPGWGYNKLMENPERIMSLKKVKRLFADCMVRNMCFLLNVGPDRHGNIAPSIEQRMLEFGEWVNATSEAIYGTRGGPWQPVDGQYGFCYKDNMIYIYFLGEYTNDTFAMPSLDKDMKVKRAYNVYTGEKIQFKQKHREVILSDICPIKDDLTVIALELNKHIRP
ncbi:MAG: alpha-L-fucosidase [Bacteroides xylanisolvens]